MAHDLLAHYAGSLGRGCHRHRLVVGPRTLITAGHCVYDQTFFGGWGDPHRGHTRAQRHRDTVWDGGEWTFSSVDRWINDRDPDFDIGCIHLDEPLGETVGWFAIGALPADELQDSFINISGYPSDGTSGAYSISTGTAFSG